MCAPGQGEELLRCHSPGVDAWRRGSTEAFRDRLLDPAVFEFSFPVALPDARPGPDRALAVGSWPVEPGHRKLPSVCCLVLVRGCRWACNSSCAKEERGRQRV